MRLVVYESLDYFIRVFGGITSFFFPSHSNSWGIFMVLLSWEAGLRNK